VFEVGCYLGGSPIAAGWKPFKGDIYQADLGDLDLRSSRFWRLFHRGEQQTLARYPNFDPKHPRTGGFIYIKATLADDSTAALPYDPWGVARTASKTALRYDPERLDPSGWSRPTDARVHVWPWLNWNRNVLKVKAVDSETHALIMQAPASYALTSAAASSATTTSTTPAAIACSSPACGSIPTTAGASTWTTTPAASTSTVTSSCALSAEG